MTYDKSSKSLWGQDFRLVAEGLAETDVVIFVERLMRKHRQSLEQLDHIASLHELATRMPAHYLGKHLYPSVHFIPAFEKLVEEAEPDLDLDLSVLSAAVKAADRETLDEPSPGPSGNGSTQFQTPEETP